MKKIKVKKLVVGQMQENCYVVWDTSTNQSIIIDPGDDADFITQFIQSEELDPQAIVATHGHFDHTMAVLELKLAFNIPFYMNKDDVFLLERIESTSKHFVNFDPGPPPEIDFFLQNNSLLKIGNIEFRIMSIAGHTPGSTAFYLKDSKAVFVGDLIFADGSFGRTDFSYSDKSELLNSVAKINKLPSGTIIYPGHGEEFIV